MSHGALPLLLGLAALLTLAATGCESTQDKSARLARESGGIATQQGVTVTKSNRDVRVLGTSVVTDANGTAVVVRLRNASSRPQADVPVALDVRDAAGTTVFTNATPGLERSLTHAALVPARGDAVWVNDQVFASEPPKRASAKVGAPEGDPPADAAAIRVGRVRLTEDPVSGLAATGAVTNPGSEDQRRVLLTAVATEGDRVVAAGRGVIPRVRAGKRSRFRIFFIGDPKGAELTVTAAPGPTG
ncbi:MAG TPA: hypothetical protein PKD63_12195 [Solirubrobacteraceae bacterium]|nr:hypothetical protein [Solirubrobacteraceae bacterium]